MQGRRKGQGAANSKVKMKIKIISWNVRGVNDPEKRRVIKSFLRNNRADLVCLQETKVQQMDCYGS